ncbi:MAG: carbohydrate ABC transporter permease [Caldilineaceae bacterium]|nr:carbohydrate ABC transporter permease [Caldilineaceae bacterium]
MIGYRMQNRIVHWLVLLGVAVVLVVVLFPIYWMLLTGIKPKSEIYLPIPTLWTSNPTLDNIRSLFNRTPFPVQMRNSLFVSTVTTAISIVVSSLAGYSLSRLHYPGRDFFSSAVFFIYLIPGMMTLIPLYVFLSRLGLLNTLYSLILAYLAGSIPFAIWILKGYFTTIPTEMEDAALVDGCTRLQALYKVILPLAAPGIVACAIFAFTLSWNEYLLAMLFINSREMWTLPVGLAGLVYGDVFLWGEIMIGAFLMSLPVLVLYVVAQRFVVAGLTAGAVKG